MREAERIERESLRYAVLVFAAFGLLFSGLAAFVHQAVGGSLFSVIDEELLDYAGTDGAETLSLSAEDAAAAGDLPRLEFSPEPSRTGGRVAYIARDSSGGFVAMLGMPDAALPSVPFEAGTMEKAYLVSADGHRYRAVNFASDDPRYSYVQAVANVDSETAILDRLTAALVVGMAVALTLSAAASYLLSRRTLRPIALSWEKQTEFVQNASHELRTPLAVILANQELLLDDATAPVVDKLPCIDATIEEASRLARLTDELLTLTTIDGAAACPNARMLDVGALASDMASSYEDLAAAQGKTLAIRAETAEAVADADKLRQLLAILLDNALKYTEAGDSIEVRVLVRRSLVSITVSDTGIGIADEDMRRAFERFYRADKARSRATGGNGLGLSIAKGIVDAHGGAIRMTRNHPEGVSVITEIPLCRRTRAAPAHRPV